MSILVIRLDFAFPFGQIQIYGFTSLDNSHTIRTAKLIRHT